MNARQSGAAKRAEGGGGGLGQHGADEAPVNRLKPSSSTQSLSKLSKGSTFTEFGSRRRKRKADDGSKRCEHDVGDRVFRDEETTRTEERRGG